MEYQGKHSPTYLEGREPSVKAVGRVAGRPHP